MHTSCFCEAAERFNLCGQVAPVHPAIIESVWERGVRSDPHEAAVAPCDTASCLTDPEQQFATVARYALLDALVQRGDLTTYMSDESSRRKVFAAAATVPCNKNDLIDAMTDVVSEWRSPEEDTRSAGKRDYLIVLDKFVRWMRDHC